jgi:hypothetical protein
MSTTITNQIRELAQAKLASLIEKEGIKPLDVETLRSMGQVWPDDESVDDFLESRERWRNESPERTPPDK